MNLGEYLAKKIANKQKNKVRDGTPQHYSKSCENNGGCPYCEGNKFHSTNKRKDATKDKE